MRRRLLAGFLAFAVVIIVLLEIPLGIIVSRSARTTAIAEIEHDSASLGVLVGSSLQRRDVAGAQGLIDRFARAEHAIVAVVGTRNPELSAGAGVAEEIADPTTKAILKSADAGRVQGEEGSQDPDDDLLYVAIPVVLDLPSTAANGKRVLEDAGVVLFVAEPAAPLHAQINRDDLELVLLGVGMLAVAAGIGTLLAISLTRPLARIESTVAKLGQGQLGTRVPSTRAPAELRALRTTINEMADRLEELLHTQRAFVADASHQLRAPMTALRLRLENLEESVGQPLESDMSRAIAEVDRLSRIVDGLLALARSDGARPERVPVYVTAALEDRTDAWSALASERHVSLIDAVDDDDAGRDELVALACTGYLEQMLDNLLANAIDATPPDGTVTMRADRRDGHIDIHVIDTGPGMSVADRSRAFDRFWRPEGSPRGGTGLGLAIVAQFARASGGTTWLDDAPGGGVDAVIRLDVG